MAVQEGKLREKATGLAMKQGNEQLDLGMHVCVMFVDQI